MKQRELTTTLLGYVGAVTGSTIRVFQSPSVASSPANIGGENHLTGQVGSFVRIPQGHHNLYGIVCEVDASTTPAALLNEHERGEIWVSVQLVGEMAGDHFERGISRFPCINDEVHLVTEEDLAKIYGDRTSGQICVGKLAHAENIKVSVDLDKLVTRHCAVLGSTGSGKSTTVTSLLRSIAESTIGQDFPSSRILLIDIHGEYGNALKSVSSVFRVNPRQGEHPLHIPFWALDPIDLLPFLLGKVDDKPLTQILDHILDLKNDRVSGVPIKGTDSVSITTSSPIPYSLKRLWFELLEPEIKTWYDVASTSPAIIDPGDINTLKPPKYKPQGAASTSPFVNTLGVLGVKKQLDQMRSRLLDKQYDFLLHPGPWEPDQNGNAEKDLPELLEAWMGHSKPITILDLSGIPSPVLVRLIGAILKIIYEALFWSRDKPEGGIQRPLLVVMEEAHRYLSNDHDGSARTMVQRIVKEGRKFGIGAMIVSQRPSEVDETILSQCGTFITLRLSNIADRAKIQATLPDNLAGIIDSLSVLRTGEAIITGEAARLPIRCRITPPPEDQRPDSEDPKVSKNWKKPRREENYEDVAAAWRSQDPSWSD